MGQHEPSSAELAFFDAISDEAPLTKAAVELERDTAESLGIPTVSPDVLEALEAEAEAAPKPKPAAAPAAEPEPEPEPAAAEPDTYEASPLEYLQEPEPEPEPGQEIDSFEHADAEPEAPAAPEPELPSRLTHGKLFNDKRSHPLQLLDVLSMRYKAKWVDWEPDTLWWSLRRDFGPVGELTRNKIQALGIAVGTDVPWLDWDTFENCGLAWNDVTPIFGAFQPMTPMQTAFAVHVLRSVRDDERFANEVNAYIAALLEEHGWVYAPEEWFAGAQDIIDRKEWLVGLKVEVKEAWKRVQHVPPEDIEWNEENSLDMHLLKMMVVKRYLEGRDGLRQEVPGAPSSATMIAAPVP